MLPHLHFNRLLRQELTISHRVYPRMRCNFSSDLSTCLGKSVLFPGAIHLQCYRASPYSTVKRAYWLRPRVAPPEVVQLADAPAAALASAILKPTLSIGSLLMIARTIMTWYPEIDGNEMPWAAAYKPTEPLLEATRKVIKPFNGLDVSPIVWLALFSFFSEILTGPQGILTLLQRKGV